MDDRLVSWARAVKRRRRALGETGEGGLPVLWLFTEPARQPDLPALIARLPGAPASPWLCGVIFRHDGVADRTALASVIARLCRNRAIRFVMAGSPRLAHGLRAQRHARAGREHGALTASAHGMADLIRARRAGVRLVFLSPIFPTASHPGAPSLGAWRWAALARGAGLRVAALGGITGKTARALPASASAAGAIGALS